MNNYMFTLLLFLFPLLLTAQYDPLTIPIIKNGQTSTVGAAGGLNAPQFSTIDLNNDGIKDLVIYDRSAQVTLPFLNAGTPNQVAYTYAPEYTSRFPQNTSNYLLLRDYDGDGIEDLFYFKRSPSFLTGAMALSKGSYDVNNKIQFTPVTDGFRYQFRGSMFTIFIFNPDLPSIDDIDGDGDLDVLAFSTVPGYERNISWFRNYSVENGNGLGTPEFVLEHECWGLVTETNTNNTLFLSPDIDSCPSNTLWTPPSMAGPRHAGSTLAAIDYNGDGVQDMVMGDASINTLNLMTNAKINDTLLTTMQDATFPSYDESTDILTFPAAFFLDVDNDGITDMLAAPNETTIGAAITDSVAWFYKNTQTNTNVQLALQQKDFLVGDMVDLGMDANPIFVDYNADGLLDLIIGHYGYMQRDLSYITSMAVLENTGTANNPQFTWVTDNFANLDSLALQGLHPTSGDLDGDGDIDLLLGETQGSLIFLENIAGAGNPMSFTKPIRNYANIDVGQFSAPQLVDLDRDGDLDLAVGEFNGNINYYENTGGANNPLFVLNSQGLSGFDVRTLSPGSRRASPCFVDVNGQYELFIGHQTGAPIHLKNIDNNINGVYDTMSLSLDALWTGMHSDLDAADINNDGRLDLVIGNKRGGISFFAVDTFTVNIAQIGAAPKKLIEHVFPNPAQQQIYLAWTDLATQQPNLQVELVNTLGQTQKSILAQTQEQPQQIYIGDLAAGVYFIKTNVPNSRVLKFVVH